MGFLSVALTFIGYTLVYASVANKGRFATAPWAGVYLDAYDDADGTAPESAPQDNAPARPQPRPRSTPGNPQPPLTQGGH